MEHVLLGLLVVIEAAFGLRLLAVTHRDSQERMAALMHGQEHIAELVAEVLPRTPER